MTIDNGKANLILSQFRLFLEKELLYSAKTSAAYNTDISQFLRFYFSTQDDLLFVTSESINNFISSSKVSVSSMKRKLQALRAFWKYMKMTKNWIQELPTNKTIKLPHKPKLPNYLSEPQALHLIKSIHPNNINTYRDLLLCLLLYGCGLRVSEACNLLIDDVHDTFIKITGKGNKERLVPCIPTIYSALEGYFKERHRLRIRSNRVLLNGRNKSLSRIQAWKIIKKLVEKLNLQRTTSPHTLRHSFATHLLNSNIDIRIIQDLLGHSNISTTDKYTHVSITKLKQKFDRFHPVHKKTDN